LWQAPVFVLGVAALVAVWLCRPLWPINPAQRIDRDLAAARQLLERSDGDIDEALRLAGRLLEACEQVPDRAGEAALVAADCHIRLAEKAAPGRAAEHWQQARKYLDRADQSGLPEREKPRLTYRLGKVGFQVGDPPEQVISRLEESVESAENAVEGYDLLTRAYLKLDPPDLNKALEANARLREVAEISEAMMAAAQLTGGELLLRQGKPAEARKSLEKIGDHAPPAVLVRARLLRARSFQDEKRWTEAATLYQNVLADTRTSIPEPAKVYYNLGVCYERLDQPQDAAQAWQKCFQLARGAEGAAAAIVFARLRLLDPAPDKAQEALEALNKAVEDVPSPKHWNNPLLDLKRAQGVYERAVSVFRQSHRYDLALKVLPPYGRIGVRRRLLELEGEVARDWARARQEGAREAGEPLGEKEKKEVRELFSQAAKAFGQAAGLPGLGVKEQGDYLWSAISCHQGAEENEEALGKLRRLVVLDVEPARLGEAWYRLGEEYRTAGNTKEAENAYQMSMRYDTRYAYLARYQLALAWLREGNRDDAEAALALNVRLLRWASENEALSQSLFALGNLLYQRREYRRAARYLEDALVRVKDHPEAVQGRFRLADSYRQIACQENQSDLLAEGLSPETRAHFQKEHRRWLQKAADEFTALDTFLESPQGQGQLTKEQREKVTFTAAKCLFTLGEYPKGLKVYERLIERYANQPKLLVDALGGAVTCHAALGQVTRVRQRLLQIEQVLPELQEEDDRKLWQQWLDAAKKGLPPRGVDSDQGTAGRPEERTSGSAPSGGMSPGARSVAPKR
jgi:tetratricopeptide (TPR) repeat protein